jgi:hypothetical protein
MMAHLERRNCWTLAEAAGKVYGDLLVCSLERQLDGTGKLVQAGQELHGELFSPREAFPGRFLVEVEDTGLLGVRTRVFLA